MGHLSLNTAPALNRPNPAELRVLRAKADALPCAHEAVPYDRRVYAAALVLETVHGWDLEQEVPVLLAEHQLKQRRGTPVMHLSHSASATL